MNGIVKRLLGWIRWILGRGARVRDVSGLSEEAVGSSAQVREEIIDTSARALRPGNRRRALRDPRLLPKPALAKAQAMLPFKKTRYLTRDEARRLFSTTLRTRNRQIRDLGPDLDQLRRHGLPEWTSEAELAQALGISVGLLRHFSIHRQRERVAHYVTFAIPKKSGGERLIHAPKRRLKALQRTLHERLVRKLPASQFAHGFLPGRSVASNAKPHVGKGVVIKLDLADCFPSIGLPRVRGLLISLGYGYPVAQILAVLMTEPPRQPTEIDGTIYHVPVGPRACVQGAPTSPGLCNAILRKLDHRLAGLARKYNYLYTRYADDLTFSGDDAAQVKILIAIAGRIVAEEGFALNRSKTRVMRGGQRQVVTGVTVNTVAGLSRTERRRLRAAIHNASRSTGSGAALEPRLQGKLAYLRMLNPAQAAALLRRRPDPGAHA